jgi:hypothetical protein
MPGIGSSSHWARIAENCDAGKTSFTGDTGRMAGVEEDAATGQSEGSDA